MAYLLNFESVYYYTFTNLSVVAKTKLTLNNQNSLIFNSVNLTILGKVAKLNPVNIFYHVVHGWANFLVDRPCFRLE